MYFFSVVEAIYIKQSKREIEDKDGNSSGVKDRFFSFPSRSSSRLSHTSPTAPLIEKTDNRRSDSSVPSPRRRMSTSPPISRHRMFGWDSPCSPSESGQRTLSSRPSPSTPSKKGKKKEKANWGGVDTPDRLSFRSREVILDRSLSKEKKTPPPQRIRELNEDL